MSPSSVTGHGTPCHRHGPRRLGADERPARAERHVRDLPHPAPGAVERRLPLVRRRRLLGLPLARRAHARPAAAADDRGAARRPLPGAARRGERAGLLRSAEFCAPATSSRRDGLPGQRGVPPEHGGGVARASRAASGQDLPDLPHAGPSPPLSRHPRPRDDSRRRALDVRGPRRRRPRRDADDADQHRDRARLPDLHRPRGLAADSAGEQVRGRPGRRRAADRETRGVRRRRVARAGRHAAAPGRDRHHRSMPARCRQATVAAVGTVVVGPTRHLRSPRQPPA